MTQITLQEIQKLKDLIFLKPDSIETRQKCERLANDFADGLLEVEDTERAKRALWKLFESMPRLKGKSAAIKQMQTKYPDLFGNAVVPRGNAYLSAYISLKPETTRVVVELYTRNFINGSRSVKEYNFADVKDPDRICVFTYRETDAFLVKEFDKSGKLVANTIRRSNNKHVVVVGLNEKGSR